MAIVIDGPEITEIVGPTLCQWHDMVDFVRRPYPSKVPAFFASTDVLIASKHLVSKTPPWPATPSRSLTTHPRLVQVQMRVAVSCIACERVAPSRSAGSERTLRHEMCSIQMPDQPRFRAGRLV